MRTLFVLCIVSVIIVIAWMLYLNHDMDRFMLDEADISQASQQKRNSEQVDVSDREQVLVSPSDTHEPVEETKRDIVQSENTDKLISERVPDANKVFQADPVKMGSEASFSGLTPELEKIFIEYKPLYRSLEKSAKAYGLLIQEMISRQLRKEEIGYELSATTDSRKSKELQKEYDAHYEWLEKIVPTYNEVNAELENLMTEEKEFFTGHGFSSESEFWKTHTATYRDWIDNQ